MTPAVRQLLESFDALPIGDQHQALVEILRCADDMGDASEECLVLAADELFRTLDADEKHQKKNGGPRATNGEVR